MPSRPDLQHSLDRLLSGVRRFRKEEYPKRREAYQQITRDGQRPHTLFITCADSRIDPELITQSGPGKIFVTRNIGNLVPAHGEMLESVSAVIEYAVSALCVDQIVICGHADCGAMKGLLQLDELENMPTVRRWLQNAHAALSSTEALHPQPEDPSFLEALIEQNVLLQLTHLRTHPSVASRLAQGNLALYGWIYDFNSGNVLTYNETENRFEPIT